MKQTKIERLVAFLRQAATTNTTVTRSTITRRFRNDPAYVVYFNGLRRNGAVAKSNTVNVSKIGSALTRFRKENMARQEKHYAKRNGSVSVTL